ncbi:MAG TPA: ACP phosphodiesterase [Thermoanaerobaculia bacterium]|jgi:acyl carrier protein phosphodiesterase
MNHLAHLFLASPGDESLVGNLAGDFVKGPLRERFTEGIRAGIRQHRSIDAFTDSHPSVAGLRRVLVPEHGHYARIISDVFCDYFLARHFEEYAGESLEAFLSRTYATLDRHVDELPGNLRWVYPRMRDEGWLPAYREVGGIRQALYGISHRIPRPVRLDTAARHLVDSREELERHFRDFFPEVVAHAQGFRPE